MATADELIRQKVKILESAPDKFASEVDKIQVKLLKEAIDIISKLELDGDKIKVTVKNLSLIDQVTQLLNTSLTKGEYFKAVDDLLKSMDQAARLTQEFMSKTLEGFEKSKLAAEVYKLQRTKAAEMLIGQSSIDSNFLQPVKNTVLDAVTQETTLSQLIKTLNDTIIGTKDYDGRLLRYVRQISNDSMAVADRTYTTAISNELAVEFFQYVGGEIEDTRCFCDVRNGKFFHRKEIEDWGEGKITSGFENDAERSAAAECGKDWQGKFRGTNATNIFNVLGGYNCRHSLVPKSLRSVPNHVLNRAMKKGYFVPTQKERTLLGL